MSTGDGVARVAVVRRLDAALGRLSMYRLVLSALGTVLLVAVILGATGTLGFPPQAILAVLAVATLATLAGTWVGALVTRSTPHTVSSLITGAILTLVLFPGTSGTELVAAAVAGGAAGISKYLIAWRGRHVLNPAVAGLIVVTVTGLGAGAWWVGTAWLAIPVVLTGALVLWRTRRVLYALSYALPAFVLTAVGYLTLGVSFGDAVWWALTASPILFLGAFMLSEPLTTPPRRTQRLVVGALVAVLAAAPLFLEWGWLVPEVALAIGNVIAFAFGLRGGVVLRLTRAEKRGDVLDLHLTPSRPLRFTAGQYVEIDVPQALALPGGRTDPRGRRRVLSVASAPGAPEVRLLTRLQSAPGVPPSPVKQALALLAQGGALRVTSVGGDFVLPDGVRGPVPPLALVGVGIGVTPFLSQLDAIARGDIAPPPGGWDLVLVHVVRTPEDVVPLGASSDSALQVPGGGVLGALSGRAALPAGVRLVLVVPPGAALGERALGWHVIEGAPLGREVLVRAVPDLGEREVLVSGSPAAVDVVTHAAHAAGARRVRTDTFLGY